MVEIKDLTFVLSTRHMVHLGALQNVDTESISLNMNLKEADEISFDLYKVLDGVEEPLWRQVKALKLIYVPEINEYFQIDPSDEDKVGEQVVKTLTCTSLCECELGQSILHDFNVNNEDDLYWDDEYLINGEYPITHFYDRDNPQYSLLDRIIDKMPHYSIGHVDSSIGMQNIYDTDSTHFMRPQFSFDGTDVYEALTGDIAEQFNCLFTFDSTKREINAYDLYSVCKTCGYRGDFNDLEGCPECGAKNSSTFGEDTTIFVDVNNLTDDISFETDTDSIKNCFRLVAGDEDMTSAIIAQNPNGSEYIYYLSEDTLEDMPSELVQKINEYNDEYSYYENDVPINVDVSNFNAIVSIFKEQYDKQYEDDSKTLEEVDSVIIGYPNLMLLVYEAIDLTLYINSGMMPTSETGDISATTEALKITQDKISPVGIQSVTSFTSASTVESTLRNYVKVFAKTGYVKITPYTIDISDVSEDSLGYNYLVWNGYFEVQNYSDEDDIMYVCGLGVTEYLEDVYENPMQIIVNDDYDTFIEQKVLKSIALDDEDGNNVYDIIDFVIYDTDTFEFDDNKINDFNKAISLYSLSRMQSFYSAFSTALDTLTEAGETSENPLYEIYAKKMELCGNRIDSLENCIIIIDDFEAQIEEIKYEIQEKLDFKNYLGEDLYKNYSMYIREDEYSNDNFISDDLSDTGLFTQAQQFLSEAKKELKKAATPQHTISCNLYNLLYIADKEQYSPLYNDVETDEERDKRIKNLMNNFQLGNWIRVRVDESVYRLRLISWSLDGDNDTELNVEFSDVTYAPGVSSDLNSLISTTKDMSSTYTYVSKQMNKSEKTTETINSWVQNGLNSALTTINNNNNQEITIDKHGILARQYDDDSGTYSKEQLKITGNTLALTDDNWATCATSIGKNTYTYYNKDNDCWTSDTGYGMCSKFVQSGYIYGTQIISGEIYSDNYSKSLGIGTYINLENGDMSLAGGIITFDSENNSFKIDYSQTGLSDSAELQELSEGIQDLKSSQDEIRAEFQVNLDNVNISIDNITQNFTEKIDFDDDGIKISNSSSGSSLRLSDDEIAFSVKKSSEPVATITSDGMEITKGDFSQFVRIGNFAFVPRIKDDGTFGNLRLIKWTKSADKIVNVVQDNDDETSELVNNDVTVETDETGTVG